MMSKPANSNLRERKRRSTSKFPGLPRHNLPRLARRQVQPVPTPESDSDSGSGSASLPGAVGNDDSDSSADEQSPPPPPAVPPPVVNPAPEHHPPAAPAPAPHPPVEQPGAQPPPPQHDEPVIQDPGETLQPPQPPAWPVTTTLTGGKHTTADGAAPSVHPPVGVPPVGGESPAPAPTMSFVSITRSTLLPAPTGGRLDRPPAIPVRESLREPETTSVDPLPTVPTNAPLQPTTAEPVEASSGIPGVSSLVRDEFVPISTSSRSAASAAEASASEEAQPAVEPADTGGDQDRGLAVGITIGTLALVALIVGIGIFAFKRYRKSKPGVEAASAATAARSKSTRRASRAMQSAIIAAYSSDKNDMETVEYFNEKLPPLPPQAVGQAYNPSGLGGLPATYTGPDGRYSVRR